MLVCPFTKVMLASSCVIDYATNGDIASVLFPYASEAIRYFLHMILIVCIRLHEVSTHLSIRALLQATGVVQGIILAHRLGDSSQRFQFFRVLCSNQEAS